MKLYIQTENGQPINHPAFEENLMQAFNEIPAHWEEFVRVERPTLNTYQLLESEQPVYAKVNGVWTDVWSVREMTDGEKTAKQQQAKDAWATQPDLDNFSTWVFNEEKCLFEPPVPRPQVGDYFWQGNTSSWVERPPYPTEGGPYKLNFSTATWVAIT